MKWIMFQHCLKESEVREKKITINFLLLHDSCPKISLNIKPYIVEAQHLNFYKRMSYLFSR